MNRFLRAVKRNAIAVFMMVFVLGVSQIGWGQLSNLTETFEDGNITANPVWSGGTSLYTVNSTSALAGTNDLRGNTAGAIGTIYTSIGTSANLSSSGTLTWSFLFQDSQGNPGGTPAGSTNGARVYLAINGTDPLASGTTGYALRYGNSSTPDPFVLVRTIGTGSAATETVIVSSGIDPSTSIYSIKVTRTATGDWSIFMDAGTGGATTQRGATTNDVTYFNSGSANLNFMLNTSNSTGTGNPQRFRFDNISFSTGAVAITSNAVTGNWSSTGSWVGGVVPTSADNVVIVSGAVITMDVTTGGINTRNSGTTTTVNSGGTFATSVQYINNGTTTINGAFQLNAGGFTNSGNNFVYGASGTLIFNNTGSSYGVNNTDQYWPTSNGPVNVSVLPGGMTLNSGANRTVTGTFQTAAAVTLTSATLTLNGTVKINTGGSFANSPTYGSASTLVYNTGAPFGRSNEWTTATSGAGYPANVQISNPGTVTTLNMGSTSAQCSGSITVDASTILNTTSGGLTVLGSVTTNGTTNTGGAVNVTGTVTTNGTITLGGDVTLSGTSASDWVVGASATQTNNNKAVFFTGASGTQNITKTGGGVVFFDYLVINKAAGTVAISTSPATDVTINTTAGDVLQLLNAGALDLNGRTLTLNNGGGSIAANAANRSITSGATGATLAITGAKSFSGAGTLVINTNVTTVLSAGFDFGVSKVTVNGTLQLNSGGFASNGSAPTYASGSTLLFNTGGNYDMHNGSADVAGWFRNVASTGSAQAGVPWNVTISNNTSVRYNTANTDNFPRYINGNLIINSGSTFTLGGLSGTAGDFFLRGNWTNSGTFNPNVRLVTFNGTSAQTLTGSTTFDYLTLSNSTGLTLQTSSPVTVNQTLSLTSGKITLGANNLTIAATGSISSSSTNYIVTNSSGLLVRNGVGNSATLFPIGLNTTNYTPVTMTNTSGTSNLSVNVSATITNAVTTPSKIVTLQWSVTSSAATTATITPVWVAANQGGSFTNTGAGELGNYTTAYTTYPVTLSTTTTTATGVAMQSGSNLIVVGNTGAVYTPPPANDDCSGAINLTLNAAAVSGSFASSTPMTGATKNDVFYMFTPSTSGNYTVTVNNFSVSGDKDLYVYNTCPVTYTTSGTTASGTTTSTTTESATGFFLSGTSYKILVQDFAGGGGTFDITVTNAVAVTYTWTGTTNSTWLTTTNWDLGSYPQVSNHVAFFNINTQPSVGINMNTLTGALALGAINYGTSATTARTISNSSSTVSGVLTLYGVTLNSISNTILWNQSGTTHTITNGSSALGIALGNPTENIISITGTGGITIANAISGSNPLTKAGSGAGILQLTGTNTYTGLTTVSAGTLQLNKSGGGTIPSANSITINGGTLKVSTNQTISGLTLSSGTLTVDAGATLTITGTYNATGGTINNLGTIKYTGAAVTFPGSSVTVNNGTANTLTNLEIASSGTVTLGSALIVSGTLTLTSSSFAIGANTLTLNGGVTFTSGSLNGTSSSILSLGGSSAQSLAFATGASLASLNVAKTGGTSTLTSVGDTLRIYTGIDFTGNSSGVLALNGQEIKLKSSASGTAYIGQSSTTSLTGATAITAERYIPANSNRAWRLLAVPTTGSQTINSAWQNGQASGVAGTAGLGSWITSNVAGATSVGYDAQTPGNSLLTYNQTSNLWVGVTSNTTTTQLAPSGTDGYMLYIRGDRTATNSNPTITPTTLFSRGGIKQNNQSAITVPAETNIATGNYVMIGNPFASTINLPSLTLGGFANQSLLNFFVWDPQMGTIGGFVTLQKSGANYVAQTVGGVTFPQNSIVNTIQSGQAFFIQSQTASGTVAVPEAAKVTTSSLVFRPGIAAAAAKRYLITALYAGQDNTARIMDGTTQYFDPSFSNLVDDADARKLGNFTENLGISNGVATLSVEKRGAIAPADTIFFSISNMKIQGYQLRFIAAKLTQPGVRAFLEDSYLHSSTPVALNDTTTVNFSVDANAGSYASNRFRLVFKTRPVAIANNNTGTDGLSAVSNGTAKSISVYPNPVTGGIVNISFKNEPAGNYQVMLYTMKGQPLFTKTMSHAGGNAAQSLLIGKGIANGSYKLAVIHPDNTRTEQTIIVTK